MKINGHNIDNLRYADDTVLRSEDEASLQDLVTAVKDESEKCGLLMNIKKTKVMILTKDTKEKKCSIHNDHKEVEQVQSFIYLGQLITDDGKSEGEIISRICLAKNAFSKRYKHLTNKNISLKTTLRLTKCYVWSLFTYACDTWTLSKLKEAKIEAFEMWSYRRIMRISWKEMKSNAEVLKMIGLKKYGTCFEYQEKETDLLWSCKKASFPTKISVGRQGGWKKRQRTKKKELDRQRERDDENENGTVQCEGT